MTDLHTHEAATGTGDRSRPRAALPALCATQITSWGIVYYAFPVLLPHLTAETGWSASAATAAFSAALLVSAIAGIPVGRILDRRGPRAVMTTGSLLAVAAVLAIALAPNLYVFTAAWLMAGVAMAATFYQPAFAALTRWWGPDRVRALTTVTSGFIRHTQACAECRTGGMDCADAGELRRVYRAAKRRAGRSDDLRPLRPPDGSGRDGDSQHAWRVRRGLHALPPQGPLPLAAPAATADVLAPRPLNSRPCPGSALGPARSFVSPIQKDR